MCDALVPTANETPPTCQHHLPAVLAYVIDLELIFRRLRSLLGESTPRTLLAVLSEVCSTARVIYQPVSD